MKAEQFIRVIDFEKTQHYRDRKPVWIKLWCDILQDDRLFELSEADRFQLVALLILASRYANLIPNKPSWLRKELSINRSISLENLINSGWIELLTEEQADDIRASNALAGRYQDATTSRVEKSKEEKKRVEPQNGKQIPNGNGFQLPPDNPWKGKIPKGADLPTDPMEMARAIQETNDEIARLKRFP